MFHFINDRNTKMQSRYFIRDNSISIITAEAPNQFGAKH